MTDPRETLARIRAQADAATDGPWGVRPYDGGYKAPDDHIDSFVGPTEKTIVEQLGCSCCDFGLEVSPANAKFIAASRTAVPALADALRAVLELHVRSECPTCGSRDGEGNEFHKCDDDAYCEECDLEGYPCPTVCAITRALEGETHD